MSGEIVFTVTGSTAKKATEISLSEAGLKERQHLQEWVLAHPTMLGADVKIVTSEFGRWVGSTGVERDRLDVLGLDREGRLVVVELKRDKASDTVEMQALKYAALASRFTVDTLAEVHAEYLTRLRAAPVPSEDALTELEAWAALDEETLRLPRLILMATEFPPTVTATVVFLHQQLALDIRLLAFQAYRTDNDVLLTVSQHYPPPDIEIVAPEARRAQDVRNARQTRQREANTVARLVEAGALEAGARLTFKAPSQDLQTVCAAHFAGDPNWRYAEWQDDAAKPLMWLSDSGTYSTTGLAQKILEVGAQRTGAIQGPAYWVTEDDQTLVELAATLPGGGEVPVEAHVGAINPVLRPVYDALGAALRDLGPDVVVRSRVKGIGYLAQRKIADLRFRNDHVSVIVRGLDRQDPDVAALAQNDRGRHVLVRAATTTDVANILPLLKKAYAAQQA